MEDLRNWHNMTTNKTILIVDDQNSILKTLERILSRKGYNILSASNGTEALELIANRKDEDDIFLILADQRMPKMTGIEMLEETMDTLPDAIRVLMSGYSDRESVAAALNQKIAHRFISKPWNIDELDIVVHYASEYPEKLREIDIYPKISECCELNIMQKDIKKFNDYRNDMTLGKIALNHGFITRRQLESAMTATQSARQAGRDVSLENILFEKELISSEDMGKLIAASRRTMGKSFGVIAVKEYGVSLTDIKRCLDIQSKEFAQTSICRLIGSILVSENVITEEQRDSIIIDMTYSEREEILKSESDSKSSGEESNKFDSVEKKIILNKKKQLFFRQRAFDKLFCKIAIDKNFVTEQEVLDVLEEQLIDFGKSVTIKKIRDIMLANSIISDNQADIIDSVISKNSNLTQSSNIEDKKRDTLLLIGDRRCFELTISADEMEAKIRLVGKMPVDMNPENLKYLLRTHQIIYGLADDIDIELFIRRASTKNRKPFIIARGRAVKPGRNATIKYFFEDENARFGRELASGKFDYRDRGEIVNVTPGTVLARKVSIIQPIKGSTVKGLEIPAPIALDVELSAGKGAAISKDGLTVTAEVNGRPDLTIGGRISVMHEKAVDGNVDFRTGNIIFGGDVNVTGTLLPGFSVKADNLTVNDIDEGEVNVENNIIVKNNIINANIVSGGNLLVAQSMKKSVVSARGDVVIEKEIIDCTIITSGKVLISRGRIIASLIHAAKGIEAKEIGSQTSSPCSLFPGSDDHANDAINKFNEQIDSEKKRLEELEGIQKECEKKIFEQLNTLSDMSKIQEGLLTEKENALLGIKSAVSEVVKKHITERAVELDKNISKVSDTINKLFYQHEKSQAKSKSIQIKVTSANIQIHKIIKERNEFQKWYENQTRGLLKRDIPSVTVHGLLFAGTQIKAPRCAMKAASDIRSSKIYQVLNNDNPDIQFYEMKIEPIVSSRGRR